MPFEMMFMVYQGNLATTLPNLDVILQILDETLLPRGYTRLSVEGYTRYNGSGIGNVSVRHYPVPRGVLIDVEGSSFGIGTSAELLRKLRVVGLDVERGEQSADGRFYLVSEKMRREASNGI